MISQDSRANPQIAANAGVLSILAAGWLARTIVAAVRERGRADLCLAGGKTPQAAYRVLGEMAGLPWGDTHLWFGDERCVPPDDPESNYKSMRDAIGDRPAVVHRLEAEDPDVEAAAARYAAGLPPRFDLVLLGLGEDGHVASLFPGSPVLDEDRYVVPVLGPHALAARLTLTPRALAAGRAGLVLASGVGKAAAVSAALTGPFDPKRCPAVLARRGQWLIDREAASALPRGFRLA